MRVYLDEESFAEIVRDYAAALEKCVAIVRLAKSSAEVRSACHDLIAISGTLGLTELMLTSEYLADVVREKRFPIAPATEELEKVANRAMSALRICLSHVHC
jgi:hypothetical protein